MVAFGRPVKINSRSTHGSAGGSGRGFFPEAVGAGPRKHRGILGLGMADGTDLRVHPTAKAVQRVSCQSQGQGHEDGNHVGASFMDYLLPTRRRPATGGWGRIEKPVSEAATLRWQGQAGASG